MSSEPTEEAFTKQIYEIQNGNDSRKPSEKESVEEALDVVNDKEMQSLVKHEY